MVAVQSLSPVDSFKSMNCSTPGFPVLHYLLEFAQKFTSIKSVMPPNHLILSLPFFACPQSFPASRSFPMSWLFASCGQSLRASASALVLPMKIQGRFSLGLTGVISLESKGLSGLLQYHNLKASILQHSAFFMVQLSHPYDYWENHSFGYTDLSWQSDVSAF